jgi:hypothetical protein
LIDGLRLLAPHKKRDRKNLFCGDVRLGHDKACALTAEASGAGARLIAFPESFVPSFPVWAAVQAPIKSHDFFKRWRQIRRSNPFERRHRFIL